MAKSRELYAERLWRFWQSSMGVARDVLAAVAEQLEERLPFMIQEPVPFEPPITQLKSDIETFQGRKLGEMWVRLRGESPRALWFALLFKLGPALYQKPTFVELWSRRERVLEALKQWGEPPRRGVIAQQIVGEVLRKDALGPKEWWPRP